VQKTAADAMHRQRHSLQSTALPGPDQAKARESRPLTSAPGSGQLAQGATPGRIAAAADCKSTAVSFHGASFTALIIINRYIPTDYHDLSFNITFEVVPKSPCVTWITVH